MAPARMWTLLLLGAVLAAPPAVAVSFPSMAGDFSLANPLAASAAYLALAVSLFVLGQSLLLGRQGKAAHQEALVLLLALAARAGVSPESPEFLKAEEAIHGKRRGKAAKSPKPSRKDRKAAKKAAKQAAKAAKATG